MDYYMADGANINHLKMQYPGLQDPISEVLFGRQRQDNPIQSQTNMNPDQINQELNSRSQEYQAQMQKHMDEQAALRQLMSNSVPTQKSVIKLPIEIEISISIKQV